MVKGFKSFRGRMRERLLVRTFRAAKKIPAPLSHPCPNYNSPYVNRIEAIWGSYFHITQRDRRLVIYNSTVDQLTIWAPYGDQTQFTGTWYR